MASVVARFAWAGPVLAASFLIGCSDSTTVESRPVDLPTPPAWAHLTSTAPERIGLAWDDAEADDAGYVIERAAGSPGGLAPYDTTEADAEEYRDARVTAGTRYYYRIRTRDPIGRLSDSQKSEILWGDAVANQAPVQPHDPFPPTKSLDLSAETLSTLRWQGGDPDDPEPARTLYFGSARNDLREIGTDLSADSFDLTVDLVNSRFYFWRVRSVDDHGATALSPIWSFGTTIERVEVPADDFIRGDCGTFSPDDAQRYCWSANPLFLESFTMDKFEVTNQLYAQFLNELLEDQWIYLTGGEVRTKVLDTLLARIFPDGSEHAGIAFENEGFLPRPGRENHPVVEVSWHGANRFARFYGRTLPLEVQWEKAARGNSAALGAFAHVVAGETSWVGIGFPYPWGATPSSNRFNYLQSGDPFESSVGISTTPVGYYDGHNQGGYATQSNASPYGIFDLAGNVAEWCADDFIPYQGGVYGKMKVVKGGGWRSQSHWCQTFWRQEAHPDTCDNLIGFRTVSTQ